MKHVAALACVALSVSACGGATQPSLSGLADISGVWTYKVTLSSMSLSRPQDDCLTGNFLAWPTEPSSGTLTIRNTGERAVSAVMQAIDGSSCTYEGGITFSLSVQFVFKSCSDAIITGVRCSNGMVRDLRMFADNMGGEIVDAKVLDLNSTKGYDAVVSGFPVSQLGGATSVGLATLRRTIRATR